MCKDKMPVPRVCWGRMKFSEVSVRFGNSTLFSSDTVIKFCVLFLSVSGCVMFVASVSPWGLIPDKLGTELNL